MATRKVETQKRLFNKNGATPVAKVNCTEEATFVICSTCEEKKFNCKGGKPNVEACFTCAKRDRVCNWAPTVDETDELQKDLRVSSSDEAGDEARGKRPKTEQGGIAPYGLKLACPYFQRDPTMYRGACSGPGWKDIARLKEHLYRVHALKEQCPRCNRAFKDAAEFKNHLEAQNECERSQQLSGGSDGFDRKQGMMLKSRKRNGAKTNREKWNLLYSILFPYDTSIPEPFHTTQDCMKLGPKEVQQLKVLLNQIIHEHHTQASLLIEKRYAQIAVDLKVPLEEIAQQTQAKVSCLLDRPEQSTSLNENNAAIRKENDFEGHTTNSCDPLLLEPRVNGSTPTASLTPPQKSGASLPLPSRLREISEPKNQDWSQGQFLNNNFYQISQEQRVVPLAAIPESASASGQRRYNPFRTGNSSSRPLIYNPQAGQSEADCQIDYLSEEVPLIDSMLPLDPQPQVTLGLPNHGIVEYPPNPFDSGWIADFNLFD